MEIHLEKATTADAKDLASIQIEAFRSLYETYSDGQSTFLSETEDFVRWFECGHDVYKIFADAALAGGLAVMKSKTAANEYCLARIFISPNCSGAVLRKSHLSYAKSCIRTQIDGILIALRVRTQINAVLKAAVMLIQARGV